MSAYGDERVYRAALVEVIRQVRDIQGEIDLAAGDNPEARRRADLLTDHLKAIARIAERQVPPSATVPDPAAARERHP